MSYEILYGRQFIDLENGTYVPLILSGSNNCSMFHNGREIAERHWWPIGNLVGKTEEELLQWMDDRIDKDNPGHEWFMQNGKWLFDSSMPKWFKSGVKSALTIEDIKKRLPEQSLYCFVSVYDNDKHYSNVGYNTHENKKFVCTTEELLQWIDEYNARVISKKEHESIYPHISFSGIKPLGLGIKNDVAGPVICKIGTRYLIEYDAEKRTYSYGPDISKAIVFESSEAFKNKTMGLIRKYQLIKAARPKKEFVIKVSDGSYCGRYVEKQSRSRLHFASRPETAKGFASEKAASKYIEESLKGKYSRACSFIVEKI